MAFSARTTSPTGFVLSDSEPDWGSVQPAVHAPVNRPSRASAVAAVPVNMTCKLPDTPPETPTPSMGHWASGLRPQDKPRATGNFPIPKPDKPVPPWKRREEATRAHLLQGFGVVAGNLTVVGTVAAVVGNMIPVVSPGVFYAGLFASLGVQLAAIQTLQHSSDRGSQAVSSLVLHAATGASLGLLVPMVAPHMLVSAALMTGGVVGSLVFAALVLPAHTFDTLQGPLLTGLTTGLVLGAIECVVPVRYGVFGALGVVNSLLGLCVGMGFVACQTSRMAEEAKRLDFNPIQSGTQVSMAIHNLFVHVLTTLSKDDARKRRP